MTIHDMQNLCRLTMNYIAETINPGASISDIKAMCEDYMLSHGVDSFWYHGIGCLIFSGTETTASISGKDYKTPKAIVLDDDVLTIDLSPQHNNIWGDYARTIVIQNGTVCSDTSDIINKEWQSSLIIEQKLHQFVTKSVTPDTTFEELYYDLNNVIAQNGFENLDFMQNLGHSIERHKDSRLYIEKGNTKKLSSVEAFTFEPHIRIINSKYGYKMENIYCFKNGIITEL